MKSIVSSILLLCTLILISCSENDPISSEYSHSMVINGVTLFVKNGTTSSDGELKLVNNSDKKIFIGYKKYPYCSFSFYSIEKRNNIYFNWESLLFIENENRWIERNEQDSIIAICDLHLPPLELNPSECIMRKISGLIKGEEYRIIIIFSYEPSDRGVVHYTIGSEYFVE